MGRSESENPPPNLAMPPEFGDFLVSLPGDDRAAKNAREIPNNLASCRTPIDPDDLLMAARAMVNHLILVT
ncbi:MAG: virulence-associated protein, partial [Limnospira sp. PMC 1234.20]|uniref:virulence-associated protein n=1 Tax=Limnospira sp. PMC 1234.20 TaxID=2981032 RepID=UPI0028E15D10